MKKSVFVFFVLFSVISILFPSCSENKEKVESKWKVLDKEEYKPAINEESLYSSLEELEKVLLAPMFYFEEGGAIKGFTQKISYTAKSKVEEGDRVLVLNETVKYSRDEEGNFLLSYQNEDSQGWDMIWKDNFLYRKMLGGEFSKTFSMGEHRFYKESLFTIMPEIYSIFRENAKISSAKGTTYNNESVQKVVIKFSDDKNKRSPLPEKKYLQNSYGLEEMKNDKLIADFQKKDKKQINGELTLFVSSSKKVLKMEMDLNFVFTEENVTFNVKGERELSTEGAGKIAAPQFAPEYHRRSLDATKNIMEEEKKNDKTK